MGTVTIQLVAAEAGVSATTVSNVLTGRSERMRAGIRDRVSAPIERLGYRPLWTGLCAPARLHRTGGSLGRHPLLGPVAAGEHSWIP